MISVRRRLMLVRRPFEWVTYHETQRVVLKSTVERSIKSFTFYGDSTQAGTPTPESPVPIVSIVNPKAEVAPLTRIELDPDLELRGLPQLDANNNLYYDGDEYNSDGSVTRPFVQFTFNGTEYWVRSVNTNGINYYGTINLPQIVNASVDTVMLCDKLQRIRYSYSNATSYNGSISFQSNKTSLCIVPPVEITDLTTFKSWLASNNVTVMYKLATPITESADPYITPVAVNRLGTEEFIDDRDVPIPVGHETVYTDGETTVTDKVPYLFRRVPAGNKKTEKIVGGTVAWNQLIRNGDFYNATTWSKNRCDLTVANNIGTFTCNDNSYSSWGFYQGCSGVIGHKCLAFCDLNISTNILARNIRINSSSTRITDLIGNYIQSNPINNTWYSLSFMGIINHQTPQIVVTLLQNDTSDVTIGDTLKAKNINFFDLTAMFGSTIADYIYSLEQATTGAGVAWFKALFPKDYYPYNAGQLMSVKTSANVMTGINQWDEEWEVGGIVNTTGETYAISDRIRSKNFCPCIPSTNYCCTASTNIFAIYWYDASKNYIIYNYVSQTLPVKKSPSNAYYFKVVATYGTTYNNDICINFSDPSINGKYVPYKISKTIAATYTLRGIGTAKDTLTVRSDGTGELTRNIGEVDIGTLDWEYYSSYNYFSVVVRTKATNTLLLMCSKYVAGRSTGQAAITNGQITSGTNNKRIIVKDSSCSDAETFKTSNAGVILYYELEIPIVTQLTPEEVAAILNNAISYDVNTSITANNDSNIDQQFAITIAQEADPVLNNNSWEFISAASTSGNAKSYWSVGDTKKIKLQGTCGTLDLDTTVNVFILGFNHNAKLEGKGITFGGFKTSDNTDIALVDSHYTTTTSTDGSKWFNMSHWGASNYGGWAGCDMRYDILGSTDVAPSGYGSVPTTSRIGYDATSTCAIKPVASTLMSCLPADLRTIMKPITKYTDNASGGSHSAEENVTASIDYLPLLAEYEIFGSHSYANEYEYKKQAQYAYYVAGNSKVKYQHSSTGSKAYWLERSPVYDHTARFCVIPDSGNSSYRNSAISQALAPIFLV